jgi:hypothetical protein
MAALSLAELLLAPAARAQSVPPGAPPVWIPPERLSKPDAPAPDAQAPASPVPAVPPPSAPPAAAAASPPPARLAKPTIMLHADQPRAKLELLTDDGWMPVCSAPCAEEVDPAGTYRVAGPSLRPSRSFRLPRSGGLVRVDAQLGSQARHTGGVVMILLGVAAGVVAIASFHPWSVQNNTSTEVVTPERDDAYIGGLVSMVAALGLTAIGMATLASGGSSVDVR